MTEKKILYVLCGLPMHGKTFLRDNSLNDCKKVYSTDDAFEELARERGQTYNEVFASADGWSIAQARANAVLDDALARGESLIIDQTNLSRKKRAYWIRTAREHGYRVECHFVAPAETPAELSEIERRANGRKGKKTIPESVLSSMRDSFETPSLDEGFYAIIQKNIWGEIVSETI